MTARAAASRSRFKPATALRAVIAPAPRERPLVERLAGSPLLPAIEHWIDELARGQRLSGNTTAGYRLDALAYADFAGTHGVSSWSEATRTVLDGYLATLHRDGRSRRTLMRRRSALTRFHQFLHRRGETAADASLDLPAPRPERRLPHALGVEDLEALLAQDGDESALAIRTRTMLELTYASGLRVSEVVTLNVTDIDSERPLLQIEQGKKRQDRFAMLSPKLLELLRDWYLILQRVKVSGIWHQCAACQG